MAKVKFGSAGVSAVEIDKSGPNKSGPTGTPAGVIGTAPKGPAYVPVTVGNTDDFKSIFGVSDGKKFGILAGNEWLRNAGSLTYLRTLGVGDGQQTQDDGTVTHAGFVVGSKQPDYENNSGNLSTNPYAVVTSPEGRTHFLCAVMSQSVSDDRNLGYQSGIPYVLGIVMAASGVVITLSSSLSGVNSSGAGSATAPSGAAVGGVSGLGTTSQFVMLLNGHVGSNPQYPNVVTASFLTSSGGNYFVSKLNTDPTKLQLAGHCLYAAWDLPGFVVTGSGIMSKSNGVEYAAFMLTGSSARDTGATGTLASPNYESFRARFQHAKSPWVISQKLGGKPADLFRFHALDAGAAAGMSYKIAIENITPASSNASSKYGAFDVIIRSWTDSDTDPSVLERFSGINLDPSSDRYIAKAIGDLHVYYDFERSLEEQKIVVEGSYPNLSNIVRVEINPDIELGNVSEVALPMGFRGPAHLITSGSALSTAGLNALSASIIPSSLENLLKSAIQPPVPFNVSVYRGLGNKQVADSDLHWGVAFHYPLNSSQAGTQLGQYINPHVMSFAKFFPDSPHKDASVPFSTGEYGQANDPAVGVLDSDKFNYNQFTLENVYIVTGSDGYADPQKWTSARYRRTGSPVAGLRSFTVDDLTTANRRYAKFTFFMQGGFDGVNIYDQHAVDIDDTAVHADMQDTDRGENSGPNVVSYTKALDVMKNTVNAEIQLLALPGIREEYVTNRAITDVEERFDAMYIMDIGNYDMNNDPVTSNTQIVSAKSTAANFVDRAINSSFAAAYFPDVIYNDADSGKNVVAPPSVAVLGAMALNDSVGHPWFAPAGFTRGALPAVLEPRVKLSKANQDVLYDSNINPLVQFTTNPQSGLNPTGNVVVWGQKTLMQSASALDRVNVRRLLIELRRQVRDVAQTILFEPNRASTLARFSAAITPRLQKVQAQAGLERFKVVIDSSTTTQQDIENNTIRGKIYVQPTRTIEFVSLDFVVANNIQQ